MRSFRLKVPEHPSLSLAFESRELSFDVSSHVAFESLVPVGDVVLVLAGADVG